MKHGSAIALIISLLIIAALNGAAWAGVHYDFWPENYAWYFYWSETVLIGASALFLYSKHLAIFCILLIATTYAPGSINALLAGEAKTSLAFWSLYALFWLIYFEIRRSYIGHQLRLHHPVYQLFYYLVFMTIAITGTSLLLSRLFYGTFIVPAFQAHIFSEFIIRAISIPTLTIGILRIVDMVGDKHVLHFLLGTYHRPVEKKYIVMFIDMVGSSAIAEKLEPKKSMEMIARFIFDAGAACRNHGGDVVNYTGDGLVVLWPLSKADRALRAVENLASRLKSGQAAYERAFGAVPDFRTGLHAGNVVISQIGDEKLFLGVYGDVVNTASRIEQMNKELGTRILFSWPVKQQVSLALQKRIKAMGTTEVRGRDELVEIYTLV